MSLSIIYIIKPFLDYITDCILTFHRNSIRSFTKRKIIISETMYNTSWDKTTPILFFYNCLFDIIDIVSPPNIYKIFNWLIAIFKGMIFNAWNIIIRFQSPLIVLRHYNEQFRLDSLIEILRVKAFNALIRIVHEWASSWKSICGIIKCHLSLPV